MNSGLGVEAQPELLAEEANAPRSERSGRHGQKQDLRVDAVDAAAPESKPPKIRIKAYGVVPTRAWSAPELMPYVSLCHAATSGCRDSGSHSH